MQSILHAKHEKTAEPTAPSQTGKPFCKFEQHFPASTTEQSFEESWKVVFY
jgi:hypothetical protein